MTDNLILLAAFTAFIVVVALSVLGHEVFNMKEDLNIKKRTITALCKLIKDSATPYWISLHVKDANDPEGLAYQSERMLLHTDNKEYAELFFNNYQFENVNGFLDQHIVLTTWNGQQAVGLKRKDDFYDVCEVEQAA